MHTRTCHVCVSATCKPEHAAAGRRGQSRRKGAACNGPGRRTSDRAQQENKRARAAQSTERGRQQAAAHASARASVHAAAVSKQLGAGHLHSRGRAAHPVGCHEPAAGCGQRAMHGGVFLGSDFFPEETDARRFVTSNRQTLQTSLTTLDRRDALQTTVVQWLA
jgi:hypothetical protein